jgi:hypothetical protein
MKINKETKLRNLLAAKGFKVWDRYKEWGAKSGPRYSIGLVHKPNEGWVMAVGCNTLIDLERMAKSKTLGEMLGIGETR